MFLTGIGTAHAQNVWVSSCEIEGTYHEHAIRIPGLINVFLYASVDFTADATVCYDSEASGNSSITTDLGFYWNTETSPIHTAALTVTDSGTTAEDRCEYREHTWTENDFSPGKYDFWCRVKAPNGGDADSTPANNEKKTTYAVGPDLTVKWVPAHNPFMRSGANPEIDGDKVTYQVMVCNWGTDRAENFRVGWYYNRVPGGEEVADVFETVDYLEPHKGMVSMAKCFHLLDIDIGFWDIVGSLFDLGKKIFNMIKDGDPNPWDEDHEEFQKCYGCVVVTHRRAPTPDGHYATYVMADEGNLVGESKEDNNVSAPMYYTVGPVDLAVTNVDVTVSDFPPYSITYDVEVCNFGFKTADLFWIDVYYNRPTDQSPALLQPGDQNEGYTYLKYNECLNHVFTYDNAPPTPFAEIPYGSTDLQSEIFDVYRSWVQVESDEWLYDKDRNNNLYGAIYIQVPGGVIPGGLCKDEDEDGYSVGIDCPAEGPPQDCDDTDPSTYPGAAEICGDGLDQNCNETPDDCCDGVDCCDEDGDGWPSGPDCRVEDCNDMDPNISPGTREICADGIDQDCDGFPDDCCEGVFCCDQDNDGFGVGADCPDPQDCDDENPAAGDPGAEEICQDNQDNNCNDLIDENCEGSFCWDRDGDGYGVGVGCAPPGKRDCNDDDPNIPADQEDCSNAIDDDCNTLINDGCDNCMDFDGDGWYVGDGDDPNCTDRQKDCDETNDAINPGAPESCDDLIDNNCNGVINEAPSAGNPCKDPDCVRACLPADYVDSESIAASCDSACEACVASCPDFDCYDLDGDGWPAGTSCSGVDCDDEDDSVNPGAFEECDQLDNDCDGTADDGYVNRPTPDHVCPNVQCVLDCMAGGTSRQDCMDVDCAGTIQDCIDHDGDGWGVGPDCVGGEDPNDSDPSTYPGAEEICGDGIDQSGDGWPDEGCTLCTDHDGDGFGVGPFCSVRDCNDEDDAVYPGASERCSGRDLNCDGYAPINSACETGCDCSHAGGSPVGRWPETTLLLLLGLWLFRRRRTCRR